MVRVQRSGETEFRVQRSGETEFRVQRSEFRRVRSWLCRKRAVAQPLLVAALLALSIAACGPSDGHYVENYGNGSKKEEGSHAGGARVGEWRFYWQDGTLKTVGYYDKGTPDGEWTYYDTKGKVIAKGVFKDGRMWDGTHVRYVMGTMKMMRFKAGKEDVK